MHFSPVFIYCDCLSTRLSECFRDVPRPAADIHDAGTRQDRKLADQGHGVFGDLAVKAVRVRRSNLNAPRRLRDLRIVLSDVSEFVIWGSYCLIASARWVPVTWKARRRALMTP